MNPNTANGTDAGSRAAERLAASRLDIERGLAAERPGPVMQVVTPLAREHPWQLVAASAAAGALIAAVRPWRWLPPPAVLASLLSQLALNALQQRHRQPHDDRHGHHRHRD